MKKLAFVLSLLLFFFSQAAAESHPREQRELSSVQYSFEEGVPHTFTLDYKLYFKVMSAREGACTLSVQDVIYDEQQDSALLSLITSDLNTLAQAAGTNTDDLHPHTVYVVDETPFGIQRFGNRVYCRTEDIQSGAYRDALTAAVMGLEEPWKSIGFSGYAFSKAVDQTALRLYYAQEAQQDVLSLFPAYFLDAFADGRMMGAARDTAISLCAYVIRTDGFAAFVSDNCDPYKQAWLNGLGVSGTYTDPYAGLFDLYAYTSNAQYPLIITTDRRDIFYIQPMPEDMETPREIRDFLYEVKAGMDAIIAGITRDAPEWEKNIQRTCVNPIKYYCDPKLNASFTNDRNRTIQLGYTSSVLHELGHILAPPPEMFYNGDYWKCEAIANYLTYTYYPPRKDYEFCFHLLTDMPEDGPPEDESEAVAWQWTKEGHAIYLRHAQMPQSLDELDYRLYVQGNVIASHLYPSDAFSYRGVAQVYETLKLTPMKSAGGNELTYDEAYLFADYLIGQYGLSDFLTYCTKEKLHFQEAFGRPYEELKAEWLDYLLKEQW